MITVPDVVLERIRIDAVQAYPDEGCGVLLGRFSEDGQERIVQDVQPLVNSREPQERYHRFRIEPLDYLKAERQAAEWGLEIVGIYHSHPDHPAVPSDYDRDHALPGLSYIVVAVRGGQADEPVVAVEPVAERTTSWTLAEDRSQFRLEAELDPVDARASIDRQSFDKEQYSWPS
ncbi:M67 family metallopeptidase [Brooklawnia cerclae]|uniref:Proteasome lid subunit RPN8/RPN11 n=1 Tax=Brooklawnia cerclae TaxID=349934 RepID=A0ABX0SGJ6_9ACTN|nr:M67 family metallopeptidase [Brooklawnia cerclae]NIH57115.1 proteasome lid subunit RPN8/RPN11 [Brooklawnia cerclae]